MVFTAEDRILIKNLYLLKGYNCTRLLAEFPEKNWKKEGLKKLLRIYLFVCLFLFYTSSNF